MKSYFLLMSGMLIFSDIIFFIFLFSKTILAIDTESKTVTLMKTNRLLKKSNSDVIKWEDINCIAIKDSSEIFLVKKDGSMTFLDSFKKEKNARAFRDEIASTIGID